ncbi:hypothetical protein Leryth_024357 [Lithospermum erythrorhizon]|nr:hypothetical protein Leryth_024357 [Lithospermum erythrorhizon]
MDEIRTLFCGTSNLTSSNEEPCTADVMSGTHSSSCISHALVIFFDFVLLLMLLFNMITKVRTSKPMNMPSHLRGISQLQLFCVVFNGLIALIYVSLGIWILEEKLRKNNDMFPLHCWLSVLFHGVTWLLVSVIVSLKGSQLLKAPVRILSILALIFCGVTSGMNLINRAPYVEVALDIFSLLGGGLLLLCTYKGFNSEGVNDIDLYAPLNGAANDKVESDPSESITRFATAGFFSKLSFWWLNPLMKRGSEKTLEETDLPGLREADRAESCYLTFVDLFNKKNEGHPSKRPSILWTIVLCHWKEILISGFFALLKIITISAGPLLLNAFIKVAEGKESFKYEGYFLAIFLFFSKSLESLSQRQWYFRSRLIGLKVKSLLTAAIYQKQLRLCNAAKLIHSSGEIMNYVTVDAYRIGELPYWAHQTWTTSLQLCLALLILFQAVGLATIASLAAILLTVLCNMPLAKLQHKFQSKLMVAQDRRLKATSEALVNMKVLKLYAWETHFKNVIEKLRLVEEKWLAAVQLRKTYNSFLFWSSPVLVSAATFGACYFLGVPLYASNVFTFVATLRLVQDPIRTIPDVIGVIIQAKVSFSRIVKFLEAQELESACVRNECDELTTDHAIHISSANLSWERNSVEPTLQNINLVVLPGQKIAICGEVASGKSTLLATCLGEVPINQGTVQALGSIAYVSQSSWIQTGSIRDNILFGSPLDNRKYQEALEKCSLLKDLELLPFGDLTEIGERGVNLSGGQKQRIQLARALYQNADIYLLDDPFSAVDAQTAASLFNDYVMEALKGKTVLLVTHQVDFLQAFDSVLLMEEGAILHAGPYHKLLSSSKQFQDLVHAHKETAGPERLEEISVSKRYDALGKDLLHSTDKKSRVSLGDQLIKKEEREEGDTGFKPYYQYLNQNKGFMFFSMAIFSHLMFVICQISQNSWMAANVENLNVSTLRLIIVYLVIGLISTVFLLSRSLSTVVLGLQSSKALSSQLLHSLFRAPMSFYDSTPLGRILSRVSQDLSIVDLDIPFSLIFAVQATTNAYSNLAVIAVVTWQVLFVSTPMVYLAICLQRYYFASAKEFMRINGTTKSFVANHLAETVAGAITIRAFKQEERFFQKNLALIDTNASPFFHNFSASEWLIQRLETLSAMVLASSALCMVLFPTGTFSSGFVGMVLSYGLSLNVSLCFSIQNQCTLANHIISVERLHQYMNIPSEAPEIIEETRPPVNWPAMGKVEIQDLQIKYRTDAPLVLQGISCTFEAGHNIGIVGRTGSGKTTLIGALFRLVEPVCGRIVVDGIDISKIGLHNLRSRLGIIPQDPTLFNGTVRYNLDPLARHSDKEIWEVLGKCQLEEVVQHKEEGLDSLVAEDGSNWSMGQRQLFCLGRALLRRSKILVLDEATASIDNGTDMILQKTIRTEFRDCTVITVAHRIPTVMDCSMVLAISDGKIVEYDDPMKLMKKEGSLFAQLVSEYWPHNQSA